MNKTQTFTYLSTYPCSPKDLYTFHARPGALERLLPPWDRVQILKKSGTIEVGDSVTLRIKFGPFPITWEAHHTQNDPGIEFCDIQHKGPFSHFSHRHTFSPKDNSTLLEDQISFCLPGEPFVPEFLNNQVKNKLTRTFRYREHVLRNDILLHKKYSRKPLRLLVSGASGVLGKCLLPLLTTGGHDVWTLVRRPPNGHQEIFWDPENNILDGNSLPQLDGVIHLAGEYIGLARWSTQKKERVLSSRIRGTQLLASTISSLPHKPEVFLSSSAVGYYGDCPGQIISEQAPPGDHFISHVCKEWEKAAAPAIRAGIRTVFMRLGVGFTPQGGGLQQLLSTSAFGFFKRLGHGNQMISWMSIDDMVAAMLHCLFCKDLDGPVNIAAPQPVSNIELQEILASVCHRPLLPPIPATVLKLLYGQMASELLLSDCHVSTRKLRESGFDFRHPSLEECLRLMLGREEKT